LRLLKARQSHVPHAETKLGIYYKKCSDPAPASSWVVPASRAPRIKERHLCVGQGPASRFQNLVAERLLISTWLTSENRDGHSLWRIRRDSIKRVLISFVKAPAIDDQTLPKRRQHVLITFVR